MTDDLATFLEKIKADRALYERARSTKSPADLVALGKEHGLEFTEEEIAAAWSGASELDDDALEAAVGGASAGTGIGTCPCSWMD